jgi:hypothetical protein
MKKNLEVKNSFTVLDTRPCKKKIGWKKVKTCQFGSGEPDTCCWLAR